jgi:hypothetical protein
MFPELGFWVIALWQQLNHRVNGPGQTVTGQKCSFSRLRLTLKLGQAQYGSVLFAE